MISYNAFSDNGSFGFPFLKKTFITSEVVMVAVEINLAVFQPIYKILKFTALHFIKSSQN